MHAEAPARENWPEEHVDVTTNSPEVAQNEPATHDEQEVSATFFPKAQASQSVLASEAAKKPTLQLVQLDAPVVAA